MKSPGSFGAVSRAGPVNCWGERTTAPGSVQLLRFSCGVAISFLPHPSNLQLSAVIRFRRMKTILLLICSNIFMTFAWYGHLKYRQAPLMAAIVVSWLIAFAEYCFQVPANRIGYGEFTAFQLKIIQEVITLCVFVVFAWWYLGEGFKWNHAVSFLFLVGAVAFAFWGKL
jgi:uncharacterized protein (DUF486 family)